MAYTALYRRFRPQKFSEIVGQDHIIQTLKNQIKSGRVGHAYLLTGGRGTGKTSTAKILARAVNCLNPKDGEPCNECEICKAMLERKPYRRSGNGCGIKQQCRRYKRNQRKSKLFANTCKI